MTIEKIDGVSVSTKANVYFDGKCVSHSLTRADGTKLSVGVILPAHRGVHPAFGGLCACALLPPLDGQHQHQPRLGLVR